MHLDGVAASQLFTLTNELLQQMRQTAATGFNNDVAVDIRG